MKILTLVFVFLSFLLPADGQTVIFGMDTSISAGMSYKNPAIGGFADVRLVKGRLISINMIELANDQKVFEPNGSTLRGRTEVGVFITPTIVVNGFGSFAQQTNLDYTKTAVNPGVGLRKYFGKGLQAYARYALSDATSPNKISSIGGGVEQFVPSRRRIGLYWGVFESFTTFIQPNEPDRSLHGFNVSGQIGIWFSRSKE